MPRRDGQAIGVAALAGRIYLFQRSQSEEITRVKLDDASSEAEKKAAGKYVTL